MIDIHAHILPGVDDGAGTIDEAVEAAKQAVTCGVDCIFATPHVIPGVFPNRKESVLAGVRGLQEALDAHAVKLRILPGAEYYLEPDLVSGLAAGQLLTLNERGMHLLVELPMHDLPGYADQVFFDLLMGGVVPVLAHPERNRVLSTEPEKLYHLVEKGVLVQITAGSLTGLFGKEARAAAELFLRQRWVHFVASDLHGPGGRLPALQEAYDLIKLAAGQDTVQRLLVANPRCVAEGKTVPRGEPLEYESPRGVFGRLARIGRFGRPAGPGR